MPLHEFRQLRKQLSVRQSLCLVRCVCACVCVGNGWGGGRCGVELFLSEGGAGSSRALAPPPPPARPRVRWRRRARGRLAVHVVRSLVGWERQMCLASGRGRSSQRSAGCGAAGQAAACVPTGVYTSAARIFAALATCSSCSKQATGTHRHSIQGCASATPARSATQSAARAARAIIHAARWSECVDKLSLSLFQRAAATTGDSENGTV